MIHFTYYHVASKNRDCSSVIYLDAVVISTYKVGVLQSAIIQRSKCQFLKFSMYSKMTLRKQKWLTFHRPVSSRLFKKNYISHISRSAFLLYPQYLNSIWNVMWCTLMKIASILHKHCIRVYSICLRTWLRSPLIKPNKNNFAGPRYFLLPLLYTENFY